MKKKIILAAMMAALSLSAFTGCGSNKATDTNSSSSAKTESSAETTANKSGSSSDSAVDDETFSQLQDVYAQLVDLHNTVIDGIDNGSIDADDETKKLLDEAADAINQMGELEQTDFKTEQDALDFLDAVNSMVEGLAAVAGVSVD